MLKICIVLPVYNEETDLPKNLPILHKFLQKNISTPWKLIIADNGSTDRTSRIGRQLAESYSHVQYRRINRAGRGLALKTTWLENSVDIYGYMDIDLSTSLIDILPMIDSISKGFDLAIGNRLSPSANTKRSFKREILSRTYNLLLKIFFRINFSDAQCGCKFISRTVQKNVLPHIRNEQWFFDTELLILASQKKYKIFEQPVSWQDDPHTKVRIIPTIANDLSGMWQLKFRTHD
ncbi:MAG: glycosyltransferase [Patescibacteria group bacterium]